MEKKYTIEQFKKLFKAASQDVLKKLRDEFAANLEEKGANNNPLHLFAFEAQNMMVVSFLEKELFDKED